MNSDTRRQTVPVPWFVRFLGMRLLWALITLGVYLVALVLFMEVWVPYSWADLVTRTDAEAAAVKQALGLDRPLPERFAEFVVGMTRGDLGTSFGGTPVTDLVHNALPVTLTVFLAGTLIGWISGEALGRLAGWGRSRLAGVAMSTAGVLSATIFPPFLVFLLVAWFRDPLLAARKEIGLPTDSLDLWRGFLRGDEGALAPADLQWVLALALTGALVIALAVRWQARRLRLHLPAPLVLSAVLVGVAVAFWVAGLAPQTVDLLYRADYTVTTGRGSPLLAILGIALISFGPVMLLMRAGMEAERKQDYVFTGRAKGLSSQAVRDHHAARNAVAPVLAGSFLTFPTVLAGMMIVEYELEMTGLSSVLFDAIESQDVPVIMGLLAVLGVLGICFRLVTDVVIAVLDPRLRTGRA